MKRRPVPPALRALRVLHVDAGREWRGGQRQLLLLAGGLRSEGIEPLVVTPPASPLLNRLKTEGLASASFPMRSGLNLLAIRRLRRLLATWRPHLVHAHDPRAHSLLDAALLGRRRAMHLVVTQRTTTVTRRTFRTRSRVARFVAISSVVRDALVDAGVTADRITVVYPGVAAPATEPHRNGPRDWRHECDWPHEIVVAGVVGPLTHAGRQDALEALISQLPERLHDRVALVLLGGPAAGRARLHGVRVIRAGYVHDVQRALAGLDLLLHPGDAEGFGTAVVEAMAAGVPTVAFNTGGIAEIVAHERNGLLVPDGDTTGFALATARLVEDQALRATLAAAGPARARQFDTAHMVSAMLTIYRDLIERSAV